MQLDGNPLDEVPPTSTDRLAHPSSSEDIAIVSPAEFLKFLTVPRTIVSYGITHFERLALKICAIELAYLSFQILQALFANFEVELNEGVDMAFVLLESR